ncbi:MAG: YncE family protein, partial [Anaerolineales bacterium]
AILSGTEKIGGEGGNLSVGENPSAIAVNPVTDYVYVANRDSNSVSILDGKTQTKLGGDVPVGANPVAIAVNPTTGYVYVANTGSITGTDRISGSVSILQGTEVISTVPHIEQARGVAVNQRTGLVYILSGLSDPQNPQGWVEVLSGTQHLETIPLTNEPLAIDIDPNSDYVYVTIGRGDAGAVTILRGTTPLETFPMGQTAFDVAVDTKTDLAYVPIHKGNVAVFGRTVVYNTDPLDPDSDAVDLPCLNTQQGQNLPITITIPAGAIHTTQTRVLCSPLVTVDARPDYLWARQGFRLSVAKVDGSNPAYTFTTPLTVTMAYLDLLPGIIEEDELEVRRRVWLGDHWDWPADYVTATDHLSATNQYGMIVKRNGEYALVWFAPHVYLPVIARQG